MGVLYLEYFVSCIMHSVRVMLVLAGQLRSLKIDVRVEEVLQMEDPAL